MGYLFFQIWLWVLASFALGFFSHWLLWRRENDKAKSEGAINSKKSTLNNERISLTTEVSQTIDEPQQS